MIKIDPTKSKVVKFKVNVEGAEGSPKARLVMNLLDNTAMVFPGTFSDDKIFVNIPVLNESYQKFSGDCQLEILVDSYIFTPWLGKIEFKTSPKIIAVVEDDNLQSRTKVIAEEIEDKVSNPPLVVYAKPEFVPEKKKIIDQESSKNNISKLSAPVVSSKLMTKKESSNKKVNKIFSLCDGIV